jgi:hypothetical protein
MNIQTIVQTIARKNPLPPRPRATHGLWVWPGWAVRGLVEQGWGVSHAVRAAIKAFNLHPEGKAYKGVRAAYYVIRHRPWSEAPGEDEQGELQPEAEPEPTLPICSSTTFPSPTYEPTP